MNNDVPLFWYRQRPMIIDPSYRTLPPIQRLAIRELRDLAMLQHPPGLPAEPDRIVGMLHKVPRAAVVAVLDRWFPVDPDTGRRFDPALREDQEHIRDVREKRSKAGRASAEKRRKGQTNQAPTTGEVPTNPEGSTDQVRMKSDQVRSKSHTGVEHVLNGRLGNSTTSPVRVGAVIEHVLNLTDLPTDLLTNGEDAVDGGAAVEAALPPTAELPTEWSRVKADLSRGRQIDGLPTGEP